MAVGAMLVLRQVVPLSGSVAPEPGMQALTVVPSSNNEYDVVMMHSPPPGQLPAAQL
jgi:hypothetical protein